MQPIILCETHPSSSNTKTYSFKGAERKYRWPTQQGTNLGKGGLWNFLWRIGFNPQLLSANQLSSATSSGLLFVDQITPMNERIENTLKEWLQGGRTIIATGELESWKAFLPQAKHWETNSCENPHAGLAYLMFNDVPQLMTPSEWTFISHDGSVPNHHLIGRLATVQGERQSPSRAEIYRHGNAPAVIQHELFYYLNGHPFSAFQAWLQGQENLSPWLSWRHRLFWLDEWASFVCDLLFKLNIFKTNMPRPGIPCLDNTTIILRHDLDYSRDTAFLKEENARGLGSTHAVLKDKNTHFWLNELTPFNHHETAYHYNTGKRNLLSLFKRLFIKKQTSLLPHRKQIVGTGLLKQLKWAKKTGIGIQTIHRHLCFLIYPEWIDAMDYVFDSDLKVLGSSSLFRAQVLRWGSDRIDGQQSFLTDWPDAQFPLWYPFKLAHAGKHGKLLKGWEMTSMMEIEPYLLKQLLTYKIKHIKQNIFTLNFHPAHSNQSSFYKNGSLKYFINILDIIKEMQIDIKPMSQVLDQVNKTIEPAFI